MNIKCSSEEIQPRKLKKKKRYDIKIAFQDQMLRKKRVTGPSLLKPAEYSLETYHRSNQDTCLLHNPAVSEGDWVQSGDLLADCAASSGGELALGKNILVAYMPWEGYNFEDAILLSERLVFDDVYSSIHIERYDIEIRETKYGMEAITRNIPELKNKELEHLDANGIAKLGSFIEEGVVLVGRITPINKKIQSTYKNLLYTILQTKPESFRDSSLRAPRGMKGKIVNVQTYSVENPLYSNAKKKVTTSKSVLPPSIAPKEGRGDSSGAPVILGVSSRSIALHPSERNRGAVSEARGVHQKDGGRNERVRQKREAGAASLRKNQKTRPSIRIAVRRASDGDSDGGPSEGMQGDGREKGGGDLRATLRRTYPAERGKMRHTQRVSIAAKKEGAFPASRFAKDKRQSNGGPSIAVRIRRASIRIAVRSPSDGASDASPSMAGGGHRALRKNQKTRPSEGMHQKRDGGASDGDRSLLLKSVKIKKELIHKVCVYLAEKRKIQVGDKMAGRHGNKGIVSQILPRQDMPFISSGTPIDMVLNPLGVPSRMNVGQIYECLLGLAAKHLGEHYKVFPFDEMYGAEASRSFVYSKLYEARKKTGSDWLFDPNCPGKTRLFDGRTGEPFDQTVTVGYSYMLKLVHLVDDKIHCLTPEHDVLTSDGWLKIKDVGLHHKVATLTKTGELVYQNPSNVFHYQDFKGSLYHIKNANIDLLVTLNHRMYVKQGYLRGSSFKDYKLVQAKDIFGKHRKYLKDANWIKDDYQFILPSVISNSVLIPAKKVNMNAWLLVFGLWMAEGWAVNNVRSSLNPPRWPSDEESIASDVRRPGDGRPGVRWPPLAIEGAAILIEPLGPSLDPFESPLDPSLDPLESPSMARRIHRRQKAWRWKAGGGHSDRAPLDPPSPCIPGPPSLRSKALLTAMEGRVRRDAALLTGLLILPAILMEDLKKIESPSMARRIHRRQKAWRWKAGGGHSDRAPLDLLESPSIAGPPSESPEESEDPTMEGLLKKGGNSYGAPVVSTKTVSKAVYQVQVCQHKPRVASVLGTAFTQLGYNFTIIDNKLTIFNKQLWSYLRPLSVGASNKSLPSWVWQLSKNQAKKLLLSMCLGDGTWRGSMAAPGLPSPGLLTSEAMDSSSEGHRGGKSLSYYTSSIMLADDVMRLALHAGWSGNKHFHLPAGHVSFINKRPIIANYDQWRISIIKAKNNPAVNHGHHKTQNVQVEKIIPYEGSVYCLSVPNEVFYVRRNGLPVWTGNSRSTGPYSLVTQQPLRGRSKQGGQRLGEMEVWALEGYGAAFTLLEMLTIKSDDMTGRMSLWSNLILNKDLSIGTPESFKVLVCELQALCLDIGIFRVDPVGNLLEIENLTELP